jgi:hypothetical protein
MLTNLATFLKDNAPQQLNLSAIILGREASVLDNAYAQLDLFDALDQTVRTMLVVDTFQRFLKLPPTEQGIFTSTDMTLTDDTDTSTYN